MDETDIWPFSEVPFVLFDFGYHIVEFCKENTESAEKVSLGGNVRVSVNFESLGVIVANRRSRPPLPGRNVRVSVDFESLGVIVANCWSRPPSPGRNVQVSIGFESLGVIAANWMSQRRGGGRAGGSRDKECAWY